MTFKAHQYVGWIALGIALGSLLGVGVVILFALNSTSDEALAILGLWAMSLWWVAVICGILAAHTIPTRFERQHAVGHAQRLVDAMRRRRRRRTPDHP